MEPMGIQCFLPNNLPSGACSKTRPTAASPHQGLLLKGELSKNTIGALIIRVGLGGLFYCNNHLGPYINLCEVSGRVADCARNVGAQKRPFVSLMSVPAQQSHLLDVRKPTYEERTVHLHHMNARHYRQPRAGTSSTPTFRKTTFRQKRSQYKPVAKPTTQNNQKWPIIITITITITVDVIIIVIIILDVVTALINFIAAAAIFPREMSDASFPRENTCGLQLASPARQRPLFGCAEPRLRIAWLHLRLMG